MLDVTDTWWPAVVIAAGCGILGGFVSELISNRPGASPLLLMLAEAERGKRWLQFAISVGAPMLIGGVAAMAFLFFLPPEHVPDPSHPANTLREYDPFRLIAASLIVGIGGTSFVKSMQEKLLRAVSQGQVDLLSRTTSEVVKGAKDSLGEPDAQVAPDPAAHALRHSHAIGQLDALDAMARMVQAGQPLPPPAQH